MHHTIPSALISVAMASRSVVLEAPDDTCGYLNGIQRATFGCLGTSEKCAIYYPTSKTAARATLDASMVPIITPAPHASMVCCEPSNGDCTVQPTDCVDKSRECTGICSIDPMTLKCTAKAHTYCHRAHFESPLSYQPLEAPDSRLRPTDAPADGWFCGPSAITIQDTDASHNSTVSTAHVSHSSVSPTATLSVTITLSKPGRVPRPPVSPTATLSVTITLSKPGLGPGPSPRPFPPAAIDSGETDDKDDAPGSYDCCLDEPSTSEPCSYDTRGARLQRRQAMGGPATAALRSAAPGDEISTRSAIVSTAYTGQTDRAPFAEATRVWNIVTPAAVTTSTTKTCIPSKRPSRPKSKNTQLNLPGKIAIGATIGLVCLIAIGCLLAKNHLYRLFSKHQQHPDHHQNGHAQAGPTVQVNPRLKGILKCTKNLASMADEVADLSPTEVTADVRDIQGQSGRALGEQPGPASGRHQHVYPESSETTDIEEDLEPQSESSLEYDAYENVLGIAHSSGRHRAYNDRFYRAWVR